MDLRPALPAITAPTDTPGRSRKQIRRSVHSAAWSLGIALVEAGAVLLTLKIAHNTYKAGVFRANIQIFAVVLSIDFFATLVLMLFLNGLRERLVGGSRRTAITGLVVLAALLPPTAALWACTHFPIVEICFLPSSSPTTADSSAGEVGHLVGTDSQYLYLAEYFSDQADGPINGRYIEAIPTSSVSREFLLSTTTSPRTAGGRPAALRLPSCPTQ